MNGKIPGYPVVHVTVQPDGSAHVNVAGQHVDYPARDLDVTRAEVIAYAVNVAARLGRGVRMTTTDPDGEWSLGVYPDGEVIDLEPAPAKTRTGRKPPTSRPTTLVVAPPATTSPTVVLERASEVTTPRVSAPRVPRRPKQAGTPVATLKFSTGDVAIVGAPAMIGRQPEAGGDDPRDVQLITIHDTERNVSRRHADIRWVGTKLTITDRGSGNGTGITREPAPRFALEAGKPYELVSGDLVHVGPAVTCVVTISYLHEDEPR